MALCDTPSSYLINFTHYILLGNKFSWENDRHLGQEISANEGGLPDFRSVILVLNYTVEIFKSTGRVLHSKDKIKKNSRF